MKAVVAVCAGIALVASIVAVSLQLELRKERAVTATLRRQRSEVRSPINHTAAPPPEAAPPATVADATSTEDLGDRKLKLAQLRTNIEGFYPGLAQEVGLSKQEADRLFDLLAESQLARMASGSSLAASDRMLEDSIQALLGGRYTQWQVYQQTLSVRPQVAAMVTQLAQAEKSLSALQIKALTTALIAERQRQLQEGMSNQPAPSQMMEESLKRKEENNRRMLEVAANYLNATQLEMLREQMERQISVSR